MGTSRQAVYRTIASHVWEQIHAGQLAPGERLPNELELAEQYAVNRLTVRQAVTELQRLGAVEIRRGIGTFVTDPPDLVEIVSTVPAAAQSEDIAQQGLGAAAAAATDLGDVGSNPLPTIPLRSVTETVLSCTPASGREGEQAAKYLGCDVETLQRVETVMVQDNEAWIANTYHLPRGLTDVADVIGQFGMVVAALQWGYGLNLEYRWRAFSAIGAGFEDSHVLGVPVGTALLVRDGVSAVAGGQPLFYVRRRLRGDQAKFVLRYGDHEIPRTTQWS